MHGDVGVPIFFVISGFVLPYSLYRSRYKVSSFFRFLAKRIVRLDPPYFAAIGLAILIPYVTSRCSLHQGAAYQPNLPQILAHLGYANAFIGFPWLVGGFWSLAIEFQFYITLALVFPALLVRRWEWTASLFALASLPALILPQPSFIAVYIPLFLIGIAGFRYRVLRVSVWELACCLAFAGALAAYVQQPLYGIAGVFTCLGILFVNYTNGVLRFLGNISYSLYVTHQIVVAIPVAQAVRFFGNHEAIQVASAFVSLATAILVAWCLNRLVELPAQKVSSRLKYRS